MSNSLSSEPVELTVEARAHGWRIDHYLSRLFPNYSRSLLQKAIEAGGVLLNGLPVKSARRLRVNDRVSVRLPETPDGRLLAEEIPLDILYEDESLVVINKPADMIVHPGKGNYRGTLAGALQFHFDRLSNLAGQLRPGIVHRLDRDTTGVLVVAKDNQVHHRLSGQFERREVQKEYRALTWGIMELDSDYIETFVCVHPRHREKMQVCGPGGTAREAVTYYEVIERFRGFTYVRLLPKTGRTHQLRVHMQYLGHPIVADRVYGGQDCLRLADLPHEGCKKKGLAPGPNAENDAKRKPQEMPVPASSQPHDEVLPMEAIQSQDAKDTDHTILINRQALHAYRLQLDHPRTGKRLEFEAPLPEDFRRTLEALRSNEKINR